MHTTKFARDEVEALYQKHGAALAAYACSCGLDHGSAEDVVHQLFLRMLGGKTIVPKAPVAYLYRATRNASLNLVRNRRHETNLQVTESWFIQSDNSHDEVINMQKALQELPDEQREAVFLKVWGGMTLLEIAEVTETPLNTVASRYRYALEKLRDRLGQYFKR